MKCRLIAAALLFATLTAQAQTVAIVHAKAWTLTAPIPVENATVVVTDGKITSVSSGGAVPQGARVVDAHGHPLTPGLIHPATHLGLFEVSLASDTVDTSTKATSLGADFDVQYGVNANSALVDAGASRAAEWELLRHALDDAKKALAPGAASTGRTAGVLALEPVLSGKVPLAITTNRESDIRQAIRLAKDYSLRVVLIGATEAWQVADELAAAKIPVIIDPQDNLPSNFDDLGARLDNAALLHRAGVTVATAVLSGIHQSYNAGESLREGAGLAVANGLPYVAALRSITAVPAQIWGLGAHCGTIAPGYDADLVVWDGDPLEPTSAPLDVWVAGKAVSLKTRQTELRDRYMRKDGLTSANHQP